MFPSLNSRCLSHDSDGHRSIVLQEPCPPGRKCDMLHIDQRVNLAASIPARNAGAKCG